MIIMKTLLLIFVCCFSFIHASSSFDIIVYAATPAGLAAAISAAWYNTSLQIAIIEPSPYIGGMSVAGGIGLRDLGNESTFVNTIGYQWAMTNSKFYGVSYPVFQADMSVQEASMYTLLKTCPNIQVIYNTSLVLSEGSVVKSGTSIISITTQTVGQSTTTDYVASVFVDASYEGDVARFAGASYTYGREAVSTYNESLAGVLPLSPNGNFLPNASVSAVNSPTDDTIIKFVDDTPLGPVGSGDDRLMAFSFRLCITYTKSKMTPFIPPPNYNPDDFILLQRYIDSLISSGEKPKGPEIYDIVQVLYYRNYPPNDKMDLCDSFSAFTSDAVNLNKGYVEGNDDVRQKVYNDTLYYVLGLVYYLSTSPNVPEFTRNSTNGYALCKDQWTDNKNIPTQLYVREGLRLIGDYVFTQNELIGGKYIPDSIALGSWFYDVHVMSRVAVNSSSGPIVQNEGNIYTPVEGAYNTYEIPSGVLFPKRAEVTNLIVPVCHSATHIVYSSTRVEPTFMQLGESSGLIAAVTIGTGSYVVQDTNITDVQAILTKRGIQHHV